MKRGLFAALTCVAFVATGLACVDLFHSTDFDTLCTRSPDDPACGAEAGPPVVDAGNEEAEVDAARPHPDFCAWTSDQARTQALRACAWLGACEGPLGESAFGPCVVRAQLAFDCAANPSLRPRGAADDFWGCLATVQSCGDVDRCVFPSGVQDCVAVPSGSSSACGTVGANVNVRLNCAGPAGRAAGVEPCVMLGKTCTPEDTSSSTCSGERGFSCLSDECAASGALTDCIAAGARSFDQGIDCKAFGGGACAKDGDGGLACTGGDRATKACAGVADPSCNGNTLTSCVAGKEIVVECGLVGLLCDVSEPVLSYDPTAACIRRGAGTCTTNDTCDGDKLKSCGRGALHELPCASVGLGTCKLSATGRASCTRP